MENKENKQLKDEQVQDVAGGNIFTDIYDALGNAGKAIADTLEPYVEPLVEPILDKLKPEPPKPNPILDPNTFKIPDQYDPMK